MLAATALSQSAADPLSGPVSRDTPEPSPLPASRVRIVASSLDALDQRILRGVSRPPTCLPIILGRDVAGYDEDGNEVIVPPESGDPDAAEGVETLDRRRPPLDETACEPVAAATSARRLFTQATPARIARFTMTTTEGR